MWIRTIYNDLVNTDRIENIYIKDLKVSKEKFYVCAYLTNSVDEFVLTECNTYSEANREIQILSKHLNSPVLRFINYFEETWEVE